MIESGEKPEEYRAIKPYWMKRIVIDCCGCNRNSDACHEYQTIDLGAFYPYKYACFSYGYTKRRMTWEVESIRIGYGNPAWGAPKDEEVFIIKLGRRIK